MRLVGEALNRTVEMGRTVFVRLRLKKKGRKMRGLTYPLAMSARIQTLTIMG